MELPLAGLALALLASQAPAPAPAPTPAPCASAGHRQFDFWLGEWDVTTPDGKPAGHNRIAAEFGGCALHEQWTSAKGNYTGSSFNAYRPGNGTWHQTWVDSSGLLLLLDGSFRDGRMVLEGEAPGRNGDPQRQRITWEPRPDGSVRQHWQTSGDGGKTWTTAFDGTYRKARK
jgi:hypothetical protein